ncbi:MAG TPA: hypothetical protein VHX66_12130 [Solirubrobacteraceae bacterium]|jgi:hypothetical protein|nr:hypothetical protein [Solirubrobacteraceae bacterium]
MNPNPNITITLPLEDATLLGNLALHARTHKTSAEDVDTDARLNGIIATIDAAKQSARER